jgi:hypothetical protein
MRGPEIIQNATQTFARGAQTLQSGQLKMHGTGLVIPLFLERARSRVYEASASFF